MGEKSNKINSYIAGLVNSYLLKHEEIIHSGLFLVDSLGKDLSVVDWYFNGYSVISETISSHLQDLCKNKIVEYSDDGLYILVKNQKRVSGEELFTAKKNLERILLKFKDGTQVVKEARKLFSMRKMGTRF